LQQHASIGAPHGYARNNLAVCGIARDKPLKNTGFWRKNRCF